MSIDTIGNFLTIIRNGIMRSKYFVLTPYSKMNKAMASILLEEGFVSSVETVENDDVKQIKIALKYVNGESVIHEIKRVSKLSRRVYTRIGNLKPVIGGLGVSIVSTNKGLLTDKVAKQLNVGGEVICTVW